MTSRKDLFGETSVLHAEEEPKESMETSQTKTLASTRTAARPEVSTTATATAPDTITPALQNVISILSSLAPALSVIGPALSRLAPALTALTNAVNPPPPSKAAEPTFLGLPLELQTKIYKFYFESLDPPQIHHHGKLLVTLPGPRPSCFSKGHEALLGLTGKGRRMADLNAMYQMWCADERKIEHVFHFVITDFLPLGLPQDLSRFSRCKRFVVTCLFSAEAFATELATRHDFMRAIYFFRHWLHQLPDTAEHIEVYFEHEKVGPDGVSIGPDYWNWFLKRYNLGVHELFFDVFQPNFDLAPRIDHLKTLIISCGENFSMCPEKQMTWRKDRKDRKLVVMPNALYPIQQTRLDKDPNHPDWGEWEDLFRYYWPNQQKDMHAEDWVAMVKAETRREEEEELRRHKEEMEPSEASSKRENHSLAERRQIHDSSKAAAGYRAHSSGTRKRINSNPELDRAARGAARRMQKLATRRRRASFGDRCEVNVTQLEDIRPGNRRWEHRHLRVALLDWHLPELKTLSPRGDGRPYQTHKDVELSTLRKDLSWTDVDRKWRAGDERFDDEIEDQGKQAGASFKRWLDYWEEDYFRASSGGESDRGDQGYDNDGFDDGFMDDFSLGFDFSDGADYDGDGYDGADYEGADYDGDGYDGDGYDGDDYDGDDYDERIHLDIEHETDDNETNRNGAQEQPNATSTEDKEIDNNNANYNQRNSRYPTKRPRDDEAEQGRESKRERVMQVHNASTSGPLSPDSNSEDEDFRRDRVAKGKSTSSPVRKRGRRTTSPFGAAKGRSPFGVARDTTAFGRAKGDSAFGVARDTSSITSAGSFSRRGRQAVSTIFTRIIETGFLL